MYIYIYILDEEPPIRLATDYLDTDMPSNMQVPTAAGRWTAMDSVSPPPSAWQARIALRSSWGCETGRTKEMGHARVGVQIRWFGSWYYDNTWRLKRLEIARQRVCQRALHAHSIRVMMYINSYLSISIYIHLCLSMSIHVYPCNNNCTEQAPLTIKPQGISGQVTCKIKTVEIQNSRDSTCTHRLRRSWSDSDGVARHQFWSQKRHTHLSKNEPETVYLAVSGAEW